MAVPLAALVAAQAAPGLLSAGYKFFKGNQQEREGKKLLNTQRREYYRPDESLEALKLAKIQANNQELPGQPVLENNISAAAATGLDNLARTTGSSGDLIDGAIKLKANEMDAINDLNVTGANQQVQDIQNLQQQLGIQSGYSDKEFSYNIDQPYQNKIAAGNALVNSGGQNKFAGVDEFAGVAASAASTMANPSGPFNPGTMGNMIFDPATKTWRMK